MSHKSKFVATVVIAGGFFAVLTWLEFHALSSRGWLGNSVVLVAMMILSVVPIYPLYREISKRTLSSALAISLLIAGLVTGLVYLVVFFVFQLDQPWVLAISYVTTGLIIASSLLFIWNGLVRR